MQIGWRDGDGGLHHDTLFGVFAALARGETWSFTALRPHQREPWHAFTVQVAALALIHAGLDELPGDEAAWHDLLIALTPDHPDGEAWSLVVDDWTKPALLQPPVVTTANRADYKSRLPTPDALDMLVTSRNHDVKQERIAEASEEDWLFALITLQTMEGQMGRGNYGISRMNTGFGNRPTLGIRPVGGASGAFLRDIRRLVANATGRPDRRTGLALLWTDPWDGTKSLPYPELDELYVEICRRVRLRITAKGLEATVASSSVFRIAAGDLGGNTKDPWMPLVIDAKKDRDTFGKLICAPVSGLGFGFRQMAQLLDSKKTTPPLLACLDDNDDPEGLAIVASALVRGQGKTEGLHRRVIRTSRIEQIDQYSEAKILDYVGEVAKRRSVDAGEAGNRLRYALMLLVQGGPKQARRDDDSAKRKVDPWISRFDAMIDREFFDDGLWSEAAGDAIDHRRIWRERLRTLAGTVLAEAAEAAPRTEMRRIRAIARSRSMLDAQMAKWLKEIA